MVMDTTTSQPPPTTRGAVQTTPSPTTTSRPSTRRVRTRPTVIRTSTSATTAPVVRFKPFNQSELFQNLENGDTRILTTSAAPQLLDRSTARPFLKFKPFLQSDFFTNLENIDTTTASAPTSPPFERFKPFSKSELLSKFQSGGAVENNLDMVLKFMTKDQILGTMPGAEGAREKEVEAGSKRPPSRGRPVSDLTLLSMGVQSDDDDAISAMMELTEFGLKKDRDSAAAAGEGEEEQERRGEHSEQARQRGMGKAKHRGRKKNENLQTRGRRPRPSRPSPTTTISSSTEETGKPSEKFPHYPSKTPYGSTTELPTSTGTGTAQVVRFKPFNQSELLKNLESGKTRTKTASMAKPDADVVDDDDILADLELDLQAELDAIRKLQDTIKDKEAEEESKGNMKLEIGGGKKDGLGGKRLRAKRPMRTRRPVTQGSRPPVVEESEKDEMSNFELQKVRAPPTVMTTMKTRRPGVTGKATTSRRPMLNARPDVEQSDTPARNNPFMRRKKRPRPTTKTSRQPTAAPTTPPFVRFKPFSESELFSKPDREPDSTSSRPSPPSTTTTTTEMSDMALFNMFGSPSPPVSSVSSVSSSESPASSTPFTRFNSERNPADPSPTSFIRFEMMPHGPFFTSDLAEQSLADSMEEGDDEKLAELNLGPQHTTAPTIPRPAMPSFVPRRPMPDTPNISRRPSAMDRPDFHTTMSKMPEFTRPDEPKKTEFTRPEMHGTAEISEPEIPETPAHTRPGISNIPQFSMPNLPKQTEIGRPDMSNMPALSKPNVPSLHSFPIPEMPRMPRPPMGMPSLEAPRPQIPSMPIPTRNRIPNPAVNGRPPMMSVPTRARPERPSISFVEMSRPTKRPVMPERPDLPTPTSKRPHSSVFLPGVGHPAMNVPDMAHNPGPAMTSEMESFMEDVEGFTTRPLPKPNSTAIHFHNLLRPESQPSFEFAMENLMSLFEPTKSTGGLKADSPKPPISSFASMNKRPPFFNSERPSDGGSLSMGSHFAGNSDAEFQGGTIKSPIVSTSDVGGGNFMTFRFGPEGDSDEEELKFSTSLDLLDLRPNKGEIMTSTPHSTTTRGSSPSIMHEMPALMAGEMHDDFMNLMFDEAELGEDKSKRTTPRPYDNPYMNYFENEGANVKKHHEAFEDEATPFTFSRRPTPFPTVEAFTVRIKPTGAPISVPTTPKPAFVARPSSKPLGAAVPFRGPIMKNKRPPTSSSSFQMGFAHRSTATPFHASRPTRPKRKQQKPLPQRPPFAPGPKKPFAVHASKLDALRAKLQRLSKPKPSQTLSLPAKDISKPFKPSKPQFESFNNRLPKPMTPFKMSPVDFNGRPRPLPPHTLRPIKPFPVQRPPPKKILPVASLPPHLPTRPKMHPFTEKRPIPAAVVPPRPGGVKKPFTVRPKSTIVPHNFVQPANIKKSKQPVKDSRPLPPGKLLPPVQLPPPKHKSKRPPLPPPTPKPVRPNGPKRVEHPSPKPLPPLRPSQSFTMLNDLKAPEPAADPDAADFDFHPDILDEQSVAPKDPNSFDGPLFYGDANIKNLASPDRPPHKLRQERRPHDPPPAPLPSFKDSNSADSEDDFDYLAALYDDYEHTLFPGQHDDRPPVSTFAPGFDNFPKFEDEKVGQKGKSELPSPNSFDKEAKEASDLQAPIHGPIESLLRDLPHTGGTPQDEKPEFPRGAGGSNDVIPSPATLVGSLPRPDRPDRQQREPFQGGPRSPPVKRPHFRPSSLVGVKPFQPGVRPPRTLPPRQPPLPLTRKTPHPKIKLPKMDQELLGFISTIPGYMQKMMSNIGDNFTGRDLKAAVMRIEGLKRRHDSKAAPEDYEYDEGKEVETAGS